MKNKNNQRKQVSIFQWNTRSIYSNLLQFKHHIDTNDYCILALQSLNKEKNDLPKLEKYYYPPLVTCNKESKKVMTALYIRSDLEYQLLNTNTIVSNTEDNNYYITAAKVKINKDSFYNIISVYYPNGPKDDNTDWLKNMNYKKEKWIILGDFNSHSPFWDSTCTKVTHPRFLENIVDSPLVFLNNGNITRIPDVATHKPSAIDLSFVTSNLALDFKWQIGEDTLGSDHFPLILNHKTDEIDVPKEDKVIPKFKYKLARWDEFQNYLLAVDIKSIDDEDINKFYEKFTNSVLSAAKKAIPIVKTKVGKNKSHEFWNDACNIAIDEKKEEFKKYVRHPNDENFERKNVANINAKKVIANARMESLIEYCKNEIKESRDYHKVWPKIKEIKSGFKVQSYPITNENNLFPSSEDKAEIFVNHFCKNSQKESLSENMKTFREKEEKSEDYSKPENQQDHYLNAPLTYDEFIEALKSFSSNNSSVGIDAISYRMLCNLPGTWKHLLFNLFHKCWNEKTLPEIWQRSIIVPIHKQGKSKSSADGYRPVALTSNCGKLMEKMILKRLLYHCDKNNIIPTHQAGFRKGRSVTDHLVKLSSQIKKQFAKRKSVLATFIDIKRAYDSVWHERLLFKIKSIGINGSMYEYLENYLKNRSICTRVNNVYSDFRNTNIGIPQGSIIAPLLFSILLYDLPSVVSKGFNIVQYADDICIWLNTNLRKSTKNRTIKYVEKNLSA